MIIKSHHPLADSLVKYSKTHKIRKTKKFNDIPGFGKKVGVDNREVVIGTKRLFDLEGIPIDKKLMKLAKNLRKTEQTVSFIGIDNKVLALAGI